MFHGEECEIQKVRVSDRSRDLPLSSESNIPSGPPHESWNILASAYERGMQLEATSSVLLCTFIHFEHQFVQQLKRGYQLTNYQKDRFYCLFGKKEKREKKGQKLMSVVQLQISNNAEFKCFGCILAQA